MANSTVNEDPRLTEVRTEENTELTNSDATYDSMVSASDTYFQNQIDAVKANEATQTELQNQLTQQTVDEINQQKSQATTDYQKEQSASYVDWQKQSDSYGVNAEKMAANGMTNTGYSESSKVAMYTAYQNRVATAREVYNRAVLNYDNSIKEARLQNSVVLAEIAGESLEAQLKLALEGFQYKNELLREKADRQLAIKSFYQQQYQSVLDQINTEAAMEEEKRQFDESMKLEREKFEEDIRRYNEQNKPKTVITKPSSTANGNQARINAAPEDGGDNTNIGGGGGNIDTLSWDVGSIEALGYGKLSVKDVEKLAAQGKLTITQKGNKLYVKKSSAWKQIENHMKDTFGVNVKSTWTPW